MSRQFDEIEWNRSPEGESFDIIHEQAAFLQEAANLIATLPGAKQASSEIHSFCFTSLPFSAPFELPAALKRETTHIDDFFVHVGDAHTAEKPGQADTPAYLSVDFSVNDDVFSISSDGLRKSDQFTLYKFEADGYKHSETESTFESRLKEVGTVTVAEINALLMSIVLPSPTGNYSAYADKDLQSSQAFESLCELLSKQALNQTDAYLFIFEDEETEFHFTKEDGQTTSFTINYFDHRRNLPIFVEYDLGSDASLRFFLVEEDGKSPIIPTAKEVSVARSILKSELLNFEPQFFETDEEGLVIEPESKPVDYEHLLSNELSGLVDTALDELGLNPPNTSA